jgi:hypothetical protein
MMVRATALALALASARALDELYPPLHGFDATGAAPRPNAPDPLVRFMWGAGVNATALQRYDAFPRVAVASPVAAAVGADSLVATPNASNCSFVDYGHVMLDFGVERAAWFELESPDLAAALAAGGGAVAKASLSEYAEPWAGKTMPLVAYENNVFRLETNTPELYEGLRFAWIFYEPPEKGPAAAAAAVAARPWTVTAVRAVAQVKPVNYTASFAGGGVAAGADADADGAAADSNASLLEAIWYTGAYGSRLNMHEQYFGSILMERGDRVAIQGDGHPTMDAALAAFGAPEVSTGARDIIAWHIIRIGRLNH